MILKSEKDDPDNSRLRIFSSIFFPSYKSFKLNLVLVLLASINICSYYKKNVFLADINECTAGTNNCHPDATCTNNIGSFTCECNNGYYGDGTMCWGRSCITQSRKNIENQS